MMGECYFTLLLANPTIITSHCDVLLCEQRDIIQLQLKQMRDLQIPHKAKVNQTTANFKRSFKIGPFIVQLCITTA